MPGSKRGFKKCKYIMLRGKKAGKRCGANTTNDFCKHHTKERLIQVKKYNEKLCKQNKLTAQEARLEYFKNVNLNRLPNLNLLKMKHRMLCDEILYTFKVLTGLYYFIEEEELAEKYKNILEEGKYGKCICEKEKDCKIDNLNCRFCFRINTGEKIFFEYGENLERTKKEKERVKNKIERLVKEKNRLTDKKNFLGKKIEIINDRLNEAEEKKEKKNRMKF